MREILFKGKTLHGTWVEGYFQKLWDKSYIHNYKFSPPLVEVKPETVGQFTGLMDKNGRQIFEGDIVKQVIFSYERQNWFALSVVRYSEKCCQFIIDHTFTEEQDHWKAGKKKAFSITSKCEIIGNIYDNPELMENPL